jgi:quercetin dioxygenase-like cupin family protein
MKMVYPYSWSEVLPDHPIEKLTRQKVMGSEMLVAKVRLDAGCHVALHQHVSEQMAILIAGRVRWTIGENGSEDQYTIEMKGGEMLHIPSNAWHGVDALEDSDIIDVLSPPGLMGVDSHTIE